MNRITVLIILVFGLWACNEKPKESSGDPNIETDIETVNSKYNSINLQVNNPTVLDSSDWVIYPLTLEELEETEIGLESSRYGRQYAYWNVAFYNTETKQKRLLSESLKMLINSISVKDDADSHFRQLENENDKLIYYSITITDFNKDGKLNAADPNYLFISDVSGQKFKQVSPDDFDLIHWQTIRRKNKILIQARKDSNKDKKFDDDDEIVSFVYDIGKQNLEQIFDQDFNLNAKKLIDKQWTRKK